MRNIHKKLAVTIIPLWLTTACTGDDYFKTYDLPVSEDVASTPYPLLADTPAIPPELESPEQNGSETKVEILEIATTAKQRMATTSTIIDAEFIQKQIKAVKRRNAK